MSYRQGIFTSSGVHKLIKLDAKGGFQRAGKTYIDQKVRECVTHRSMDRDIGTRGIIWGRVMEILCFEKLPKDYVMENDEPYFYHEDNLIFGGACDYYIKDRLIAECKSYGFDKWSKYATCLLSQDVEALKEEFPQEYWQIVSNSIIRNVDVGQAIAFMPTLKDLEELRNRIQNEDFIEFYDFLPWQIRFIVEEDINNLDWIHENSLLPILTSYVFEVPADDKLLLLSRIKKAEQMKQDQIRKYKKIIKNSKK